MPGGFATFGGSSAVPPIPLDEIAGQIDAGSEMVQAIIADGLAKLADHISTASQQLTKTKRAARASIKRKLDKATEPANAAVGSLLMQAQNRIQEGQIAVDTAKAAAAAAAAIPPNGVSAAYGNDAADSGQVVTTSAAPPDGLSYSTGASGSAQLAPSVTGAVSDVVPPITQPGGSIPSLTPVDVLALLGQMCPGSNVTTSTSDPPPPTPGVAWSLVGFVPQWGTYVWCGSKVAQPTQPVSTVPQQPAPVATFPVASPPMLFPVQEPPVLTPVTEPAPQPPAPQQPTGGLVVLPGQLPGYPGVYLIPPENIPPGCGPGPFYTAPPLKDGIPVLDMSPVYGPAGKFCGWKPANGSLLQPVPPQKPSPVEAPAFCEDPPDIDEWEGRRVVIMPFGVHKGMDSWVFSECGKAILADMLAQQEPISAVIAALQSLNPIAALLPDFADMSGFSEDFEEKGS